jgi:hypothetical protein
LTHASAAAIRDHAIAEGLTDAAWCRQHIIQAASADPDDAVPSRRGPLPQHILEIVRLREVVAELTGALVMAARDTRLSGQHELHAAVETVLPDVRRAVRDLDRLKIALMQTGGHR